MNTTSKQFSWKRCFTQKKTWTTKPKTSWNHQFCIAHPTTQILSSVSWRVVPKLSTVLVQLISLCCHVSCNRQSTSWWALYPKNTAREEMKIGSKSNSLNYLVTVLLLIRLRAINCGCVFICCLRTDERTGENSVWRLQSCAPPKLALFGPNCSNLVREYWSVSDEFWSQSVVVVPIKTFCNCYNCLVALPLPVDQHQLLAMLFDNWLLLMLLSKCLSSCIIFHGHIFLFWKLFDF